MPSITVGGGACFELPGFPACGCLVCFCACLGYAWGALAWGVQHEIVPAELVERIASLKYAPSPARPRPPPSCFAHGASPCQYSSPLSTLAPCAGRESIPWVPILCSMWVHSRPVCSVPCILPWAPADRNRARGRSFPSGTSALEEHKRVRCVLCGWVTCWCAGEGVRTRTSTLCCDTSWCTTTPPNVSSSGRDANCHGTRYTSLQLFSCSLHLGLCVQHRPASAWSTPHASVGTRCQAA